MIADSRWNNTYTSIIENLLQKQLNLLLIIINIHLPALQKKTVGLSADYPADSCAEIHARTWSGYYWVRSADSSALYMYCDMTLTCKGVGGGWMQVVKLNMINISHQCPPGTTLRTDLPRYLCGIGINGIGCSSTTFHTHGISYSQVCGKIIGYQDETPDAFGQGQSQQIDGHYV